VAVGEFDEKLAELKKQRENARWMLEDIERGTRYDWNGKDITEQRKARTVHLLDSLDVTIAAYEDLNAEGS
jgi:hypothetical protein